MTTYEHLVDGIRQMIEAGILPQTPSPDQRVDFVYSNLKLSRPDVTREMVERAVAEADAELAPVHDPLSTFHKRQ